MTCISNSRVSDKVRHEIWEENESSSKGILTMASLVLIYIILPILNLWKQTEKNAKILINKLWAEDNNI